MARSASGLRFDKVVIRLRDRLRAFCDQTVPPGTTVVVTVTAPIRLAARTAASIEERINQCVDRGRGGPDMRDTVHGNQVRIRALSGGSDRVSRLVGFVHNSETSAARLMDIASEVFDLVEAASRGRARRKAGQREPIRVSAAASSWLDAYRHAYAQLTAGRLADGTRIVFPDGQVETLSESPQDRRG